MAYKRETGKTRKISAVLSRQGSPERSGRGRSEPGCPASGTNVLPAPIKSKKKKTGKRDVQDFSLLRPERTASIRRVPIIAVTGNQTGTGDFVTG